jgi:asparagine synthase (glutamine-hydrolysing)
MCGIVGIAATGALDRRALSDMLDRVAHRGPDGRGIRVHGSVGLGHTRLSVIAPHNGHQPLVSLDGRLSLVANAEIYNHVELRRELEREGHRFRTESDCETVIHAFARDPRRYLENLCGMFAFALLDEERNELHLVRDRLGIKPLFYVQRREGVFFASELPALIDMLGTSPSLSADPLAQYLESGYVKGAATMLPGVFQVRPGERLLVRDGTIVAGEKYWDIERIETTPRSRADASDCLDELLQLVVAQHLRSDVPQGLLLSGGVDSSVLLALTRMHHTGEFRTYSVGFDATSAPDELATARATARAFATRHAEIRLSTTDLIRKVPSMVRAIGEPMSDFACLPMLVLGEHASRDLKVVLTGEGGDEVFAGYGRYRPHLLKRLRERVRAVASESTRSEDETRSLILADAWNRRPETRTAGSGRWSRGMPLVPSTLLGRQRLDFETRLPNDLLTKVDRTLMWHGVEGRVPFLDHRVVEFGLSLPDSLKIKGRTGKYLLKHWASRHLPAELVWARKRGFTVPIEKVVTPEVRSALMERLRSQTQLSQFLDMGNVDALLHSPVLTGGPALYAWRLLLLSVWFAVFIEKASPASMDLLGNGQCAALRVHDAGVNA